MSKNTKESKGRIIETVIVVGAGASKDFSEKKELSPEEKKTAPIVNMPTGEELVENMSQFEDELRRQIGILKSAELEDEILTQKLDLLRAYKESGEILLKMNQDQLHCISKNDYNIILQFFDKFRCVEGALKDGKEEIILQNKNKTFPGVGKIPGVDKISSFFRSFENILGCKAECKKGFDEAKIAVRSRKQDVKVLLNIFAIHKRVLSVHLKKVAIKSLEKDQNEYFKYHIKLAKLLKFYDPVSIDNFLSSIESNSIGIDLEKNSADGVGSDEKERKELVKSGKELIAFYLLKAENTDIFNSSYKIWYRWFREAIINSQANKNPDQDEVGENPNEKIINAINRLQVINFNYDRSFNHFLEEKMNFDVKLNGSTKNIRTEIRKNTYYPYGCLDDKVESEVLFKKITYGKFSKQLEEEKNLKDFFETSIRHYAKRIFTIHEERGVNESSIKKAIDSSLETMIRCSTRQRFYFLGFGFIRSNVSQITDIRTKLNLTEKRDVFYTNHDNSKKIKGLFEDNFPPSRLVNSIRLTVDSERGVYDALSKDFTLII